MNIRICIFIPFSGTPEGLKPLVSALSDTLVEHGYGVKEGSDDLVSLVTVGESEIDLFGNATAYASHLLKVSPMKVIPREGGNNERTGD